MSLDSPSPVHVRDEVSVGSELSRCDQIGLDRSTRLPACVCQESRCRVGNLACPTIIEENDTLGGVGQTGLSVLLAFLTHALPATSVHWIRRIQRL